MTLREHFLAIAAEEAVEVAQRCTKALRFGLDQIQQAYDDVPWQNPGHLTNADRIREEVADLLGTLDLLGLLDLTCIGDSKLRDLAAAKQAKITRYLHIALQEGTLDGVVVLTDPLDGSVRFEQHVRRG